MSASDISDIEAREKELLGKPERISPMKVEDFDAEAITTVTNVRKVMGIKDTDDIPGFFRISLKHPGLFRIQMESGIQLVGHGALPRREAELAILRVGWLCRAPFEWGSHVGIGKRFGLTDEEIERLTIGSSAPGWNEHDGAIVKAVEELIADYYISDETWAILARSWDEPQLLEFPYLVGAYVTTAMQQNAIRLRLHDDNPGLTHR